jgi:hypothetical protein
MLQTDKGENLLKKYLIVLDVSIQLVIRYSLNFKIMITTEDRQKINQALAKAIAYKNCGKEVDAEQWAIKLIQLLELKQILKY